MSPSSKTASRALPTACRINLTQRRQDAKETHVLSEFGGKAVHLVGLRRSLVRSPRTSSAFQSTRSRVLDTTYFFAASIVRAKGSIHSGLPPVPAGGRHAASIIS